VKVNLMGVITVKIGDETEERLRTYLWKKHKGKGKGKMGETVDEAIIEYLDLHESEVESQ